MRAGDAIKNMFVSVGDAAKSAAKSVPDAFKKREAVETVEEIGKWRPVRTLLKESVKADVRGVTGIAKASAGGAWYVVSRPIAWGAQAAGYGANKVGGFYKSSPRLALGLTAAAAAVGVGQWMNRSSEREAVQNMNQLQMAQMQQAAMAQAQANSYGLQPGEYSAAMQGAGNGPMAQKVMASRGESINGPAV